MKRAHLFEEVTQRLRDHPVIPALRVPRDIERVCHLSGRVVFLLGTSLGDYAEQMTVLRDAGHSVFVHVDLVEGLKGDSAGLDFLFKEALPDGVISTHKGVLDLAKKNGLLRILRVFMLDSEAMSKGRHLVQSVRPDFVELLPGVAVSSVEDKNLKGFSSPLIAGGLVSSIEQIHSILRKGIIAVSTSESSLW